MNLSESLKHCDELTIRYYDSPFKRYVITARRNGKEAEGYQLAEFDKKLLHNSGACLLILAKMLDTGNEGLLNAWESAITSTIWGLLTEEERHADYLAKTGIGNLKSS